MVMTVLSWTPSLPCLSLGQQLRVTEERQCWKWTFAGSHPLLTTRKVSSLPLPPQPSPNSGFLNFLFSCNSNTGRLFEVYGLLRISCFSIPRWCYTQTVLWPIEYLSHNYRAQGNSRHSFQQRSSALQKLPPMSLAHSLCTLNFYSSSENSDAKRKQDRFL